MVEKTRNSSKSITQNSGSLNNFCKKYNLPQKEASRLANELGLEF